MNAYIELLRLNEWYKNITVILGTLFAVFILDENLNEGLFFSAAAITLIACIVSSANYVLNAITDRNCDKKHPLKRIRPLPTKRIAVKKAYLFMAVLLIISLLSSFLLFKLKMTLLLLILFIAAVFYNTEPIRLKDIPYADVLSESVNNPIRFLAGWFVVTSSFPDIFLLLLVWSLGCLLMTRKRFEELRQYKQKARQYRAVFRYYTLTSLARAMIIYALISILFFLYFII